MTDPDGKVRDRTTHAEREQYLADHAEEINWCNAQHADSVLDFGCGVGWLVGAVTARRKFGCDPHAVCESVTTEQINSTRELDAESIDLVICHHVIEHLNNPVHARNEFERILRPGGKLLMATPDFASPCAVRFGENFRLLHDPTHVSLFTLESMYRFLRDGGFCIDKVTFPFPERYATAETMARWNDPSRVSPPWPGNVFNCYCTRA